MDVEKLECRSGTATYAEDTLQLKDYSKYNWTAFDSAAKMKSRKEKFPIDLRKAYEKGKNLVGDV